MKHIPLLFALAVAGCGTQVPLWTKDYAAQATTRHYADVPPAKALAAAEEVVRLTAPARDVSVKATPGGVEIDRYFNGFIHMHSVTIDYRFTLTATPAGRGSTVTLAIRSNAQDFSAPDAMTGLELSPLLANGPATVADPYKLFFARMDYILGKRTDWVSCTAAPSVLGASIALDPLCQGAEDRAPAARR